MQDRRAFLERVGSTALLAAVPFSLPAEISAWAATPEDTKWDLSWTKRVTGKYRGVFDVPEIESGYGVWRAGVWRGQYAEVLKVRPADCSPVLVLRAHAIALAMNQAFWDEYTIGAANTVKHPVTEQPTDRNPALLSSSRNEQPPMFDSFALDKFIASGGIALACDLAFGEMVGLVAKKHGGSPEESRAKTVAMLVPGVVLQPSGVFAVMRAQDMGCRYIRAS